VRNGIGELLASVYEADYVAVPEVAEPPERYRSFEELEAEVKRLEQEMREAAKRLEFEQAAALRDRIRTLRRNEFGLR